MIAIQRANFRKLKTEAKLLLLFALVNCFKLDLKIIHILYLVFNYHKYQINDMPMIKLYFNVADKKSKELTIN